MPTQTYPLGEWTPDLAGTVVSRAENLYAIGDGYAPVKGPQAVTNTIPAPYLGVAAFIDSTGASTLLGATSTNIYKYSSTGWNTATVYAANGRMRFAQFGDNVVLCANNSITAYGLITGTAATVTGGPSAAIDVAQARDFVMCITGDNALQWCQFNNCTTWTTGTNQADKQPSLWGRLRRIIGGEYIIAITDRSVVRGTYVGVEGGLDIIWQFDEISQEVGCMAEGSVCNVGRLIFFLSERGFMMCDGLQVIPIADEKFNRWFFDTYSRADIAKIWSAIDPRRSLALWAMPGTPGTIIAYNWVLKRATTFSVNVQGIFTGYTAGTSLDSLDAIYGNLDAITISLDDPSLQGGNPVLLIADSSNVLNALTGNTLEATLRIENIEPTPGRRSRIRALRLIGDAVNVTATIDSRMREGDAESITTTSAMRTNGKLPTRCNGRYNSIEVTIPAGTQWDQFQAIQVEYEEGDER